MCEIEDGLKLTGTHESKNLPVKKCLSRQRRYNNLTNEQVESIQTETDRIWNDLK